MEAGQGVLHNHGQLHASPLTMAVGQWLHADKVDSLTVGQSVLVFYKFRDTYNFFLFLHLISEIEICKFLEQHNICSRTTHLSKHYTGQYTSHSFCTISCESFQII